jgi:hypothetical protein
MFEAIKALFSSVYGCFVVAALTIGSFWCLFAYGSIGLIYPGSFVSVCALVLYLRERNRDKAMLRVDLQIDSERQGKAIDEYVALINKSKKKQRES